MRRLALLWVLVLAFSVLGSTLPDPKVAARDYVADCPMIPNPDFLPWKLTSPSLPTVQQILSTLLDIATDLEGRIQQRKLICSQAVYDAYRIVFEENQEAISSRSSELLNEIKTDLLELRDALSTGDWDRSDGAVRKLIRTIKAVQNLQGPNKSIDTVGINYIIYTLTYAADLAGSEEYRHTVGPEHAFDVFNAHFAEHEATIKFKSSVASEIIKKYADIAQNKLINDNQDEIYTAIMELRYRLLYQPAWTIEGPITNRKFDEVLAIMGRLEFGANVLVGSSGLDIVNIQHGYDSFVALYAPYRETIGAWDMSIQVSIGEAIFNLGNALAAHDVDQVLLARERLQTAIIKAVRKVENYKGTSLPPSGHSTPFDWPIMILSVSLAMLGAGAMIRRASFR